MGDLLSTVQRGGPIVWLLIALSLASLALIVVKVLQLRGVLAGGDVRDKAYAAWADGDRTGASNMIASGVTPVDRVLTATMQGLLAHRSRAALTNDLEWRGNQEVETLGRHIRLLELVAMISPLLGLLGTVLGMIQSFQELALAEGAANASLLAAGIWQALLTTAAGLIVAIPAAVAASLLSARVDRVASAMEVSVGRLIALEDDRA